MKSGDIQQQLESGGKKKLMEPNDDNNNNSSCESSFCKDEEKVEAMDLLEECWFFENLLNIKKPKMPRCYSDPCPSTTGLINPDFLSKDSDVSTNSSSNKTPKNGDSVQNPKRIQRAPSMPPLRVREEGGDKQGSSSSRSKLVHQPSESDPVVVVKASTSSNSKQPHHCAQIKGNHRSDCNRRKSKLLRTPSLPPSIGRDEKFQVTDPRIGRYHKQTSTSKICSIPRCPTARNIEIDSINNTEGIKEMRRRYLLNQKTMMRRSLSDLELEEVQGFKDLGFSFEKESLSPSLTNIIPGLQEKNREDETEEDKAARKPYLSEAWLVQSCAPPPPPPTIPNWGSKKSASDMKEQIKFWARAVASNVHQEC